MERGGMGGRLGRGESPVRTETAQAAWIAKRSKKAGGAGSCANRHPMLLSVGADVTQASR